MDRHALVCNYAEGTKVCRKGARAFVARTNPGNGGDRLCLVARSRGGRLVRKWEDARRLTNFRLATLPPEHPRYDDERVNWVDPDDEDVRRFIAATKGA